MNFISDVTVYTVFGTEINCTMLWDDVEETFHLLQPLQLMLLVEKRWQRVARKYVLRIFLCRFIMI